MPDALLWDWLEGQLLAVNAYLKAFRNLSKEISSPADDIAYYLGYHDAIKKVLKQCKTMMKE